MSAELERQLRGAFTRLPKPTREASARARSAALATLGPARPRSRGVLVLVACAIACAIGAGAAALAATGNLRVAIGAKEKAAHSVPTRLSVPAGSHGIAIVAGGKLWLATRGGLRIEGMPVSTAELSPRALYAVVGIGSSLVTLAPGNRRPWVHTTGGRVIAAAWSPDGLKIAYVVAGRGGNNLRLIEGDGAPDRLLVRGVSASKPSWRADSLAVAYVDGRGRAAVYDVGASTMRTFDTHRCSGLARIVAYSPRGKRLAVVGPRGVALVERWDRPASCVALARGSGENGLAWISGRAVVTSHGALPTVAAANGVGSYEVGVGGRLAQAGGAATPERIRALAALPGGGSSLVAFESSPRSVELAVVARGGTQSRRLRLEKPFVRLYGRPLAVTVSWR
jgi:hypothetical protein